MHTHQFAKAMRRGEWELIETPELKQTKAEIKKMNEELELRVSQRTHEVNQPLGAVLFNAEACLSWLDGDPPNMNEAHAALERIVRDGTRAGEVIRRIRTLAKATDMKMAPLDLNDLLSEAVTFTQHELLSSRVELLTEYASELPVILADKVQLQQVILNLVIDGWSAAAGAVCPLRHSGKVDLAMVWCAFRGADT